MDREGKIRVIYDMIANKERKFGCKYLVKNNEWSIFELREDEWDGISFNDWYDETFEWIWEDELIRYKLIWIIGHPVMIWDVFDYINEEKINMVWSDSSYAIDVRDWEQFINIFNLWGHKRKPIEEQSDECVNFIYSLIKNNA